MRQHTLHSDTHSDFLFDLESVSQGAPLTVKETVYKLKFFFVQLLFDF